MKIDYTSTAIVVLLVGALMFLLGMVRSYSKQGSSSSPNQTTA